VEVISRSAALTLVAAGMLAVTRAASAQTAVPTVRIGALAIDAAGEAYYGTDSGIFLSNGINPQVTTLPSGSAIVAGVLSGDLDVGFSNPLQIASAIARGIPLLMLAPAALYSKTDASANIFVAKDSPFKAPKDLVGATLGVGALGDFNQLSLLAWLDSNGVPRDSVHFVELTFAQLGAALQRGTVQAASIPEPFKTDAIRAGQVRAFGDTYLAIQPEITPIVWFTSKSWLQKNPETAKNLVAGIYATARWANAHVAESGEMLARAAKMDPAVVAGMKRMYFATSNDRKYVARTLDLAARFGMLTRPVTFEEFSAY
jgi:NitT/TauT family transport system substrate-binding protein